MMLSTPNAPNRLARSLLWPMAPQALDFVQRCRTARERACANDPRALEYPHPGPGMGTDGTRNCASASEAPEPPVDEKV